MNLSCAYAVVIVMTSSPTRLFLALLFGAAFAAACAPDSSATAQLEARAKVTRVAAEKTALATVPGGTIKGDGIEEEDGKLIWAFDVAVPNSSTVKEVAVDAITGAVVQEAQEAKGEDAKAEPDEANEKGAAREEEPEEAVTMAQLPDAVKAAIEPLASEAEIKEIAKADVDGTQAYEFAIERAGKKFEIAITPAGKVLATEEPMELGDLPAAVRKTVSDQAVGGKLVSVEKVVKGGNTTYEAIIEKNGKQTEVVVGPDGKVGGA